MNSIIHCLHNIADGLTAENVREIRYLCRDKIPHGKSFEDSRSLLDYFETKHWINLQDDMSFLAEVLHCICRNDLLKLIPEEMVHITFENEISGVSHSSNFSSFRKTCFKLLDMLDTSDFDSLKRFCKRKLSNRSYNKSKDLLTLLVSLEEQDLLSETKLDFMMSCLCELENKVPWEEFRQLKGNSLSSLSSGQVLTAGSSSMQAISSSTPFATTNFSSMSNSEASTLPQHNSSPMPSNNNRTFFGQSGDNSKIFFSRHSANHATASHEENEASDYNQNDMNIPNTSTMGSNLAGHQSRGALLQAQLEKSLGSQPSSSGTMTSISHFESTDVELAMKESVGGAFTELNSSTKETQYYPLPLENLSFSPKATSKPNAPYFKVAFNCYDMDKCPTGLCLIINNYIFDNANVTVDVVSHNDSATEVRLSNREGSDIDVRLLENLFHSFGFKIEKRRDLSSHEMEDVMKTYSKVDHSNYNCFVCVILSHGKEGAVYGIDGVEVMLSDLKDQFTVENCQSLRNKPKIFFFQACQGSKAMTGCLNSPGPCTSTSDVVPDGCSRYIPNKADFFEGYATVPGFQCYRHQKEGSPYINKLVENLKKYHTNEDLESIMVRVNQALSNDASDNFTQMSMHCSTLTKKVFFQKHVRSDCPA